MKIQNLKISEIEINKGQVEGLPKNPRFIRDERFKALVKSIEDAPEMLSLRELLVYPHNNKYVVIGGNMRLRACKDLGYKEVPCKILPHETPIEKLREYTIKDNNAFGQNDWDLLANEWEVAELEDWGLELNFDQDYKPCDEDNEEKEIIEDEAPEVDEKSEPICKKGDIWQLGRHRLMCGDSTDKETVKLLMDGKKADMVFTDPPYGMKKEADGVLNDNLNFEDLLEFNKKWIPLTFENTKENGSWYCWGIDEPLMDIYCHILKPMIKNQKATFRNLITWDKKHGQGQLSDVCRMYPIADEKCLFVMCGVQGFNNNADNYYEGWEPIRKYLEDSKKAMGWTEKDIYRITGVTTAGRHYFNKSQWGFPTEEHYKKLQAAAQGDAFKKDYDALKKDYDALKKEFYSTRAYFNNTHENMNNVWDFSRTSAKEREHTGGHATPKPIALCARAIKSSSREEEIVLDVFGGSGSTLIACEQLYRTCYMMELDPKYCDVIIARWENLTNKKAIKIN